MESTTTDRCSWCRRTLSASTSATPTEETTANAPDSAAEDISARDSEIGAAQSAEASPPETELPKAPWLMAPPVGEDAASTPPAPTAASVSDGPRPIIGVRRPGGNPPPGRHVPAPAMPPRPTASGAATAGPPKPSSNAPARPRGPAPPMPPMNRSQPVPRPAPTPVPKPAVPPVAQAGAVNTSVSAPATIGVASPIPPRAAPLADAPVESGGLAEGMAAPSPPVSRPGAPALGTFQAEKSKYYPGQVIDPSSGTHYDADSGQPTNVTGALAPASKTPKPKEPEIELHWDAPALPFSERLKRYLGIFAALLVFTAISVHTLPRIMALPLIVTQFVGALLLPVMRVVPWADEDADHLVWFILLTIIGGPAVALIVYGIVSLLRQDANPAIVGCMLVALLTQVTVALALGPVTLAQFSPFSQSGGFHWQQIAINWSGLVALAGWFGASVFHKLDE